MLIRKLNELFKNKGYKRVTLESGLSPGCAPSTVKRDVKKAWEHLPNRQLKPFIGCYASYLTTGKTLVNKKRKWKYYVAYPSMPEWFPEFVDDFNNFYDNLGIELLESKPIFLNYNIRTFNDWAYSSRQEKRVSMRYSDKDGVRKAIVPMIRFDYSDDYDPISKYFFNYSITILVRMLSFSESFTNPFYNPKGNKMKYLVGVNNRSAGYRSFSEKKISLKGLKRIDDVDHVNEICKKIYGIRMKQTDFYNLIANGEAIKNSLLNTKLGIKKKVVARKPQTAFGQAGYVDDCSCAACRRQRKMRDIKA